MVECALRAFLTGAPSPYSLHPGSVCSELKHALTVEKRSAFHQKRRAVDPHEQANTPYPASATEQHPMPLPSLQKRDPDQYHE